MITVPFHSHLPYRISCESLDHEDIKDFLFGDFTNDKHIVCISELLLASHLTG